jgi:hypothetical protein
MIGTKGGDSGEIAAQSENPFWHSEAEEASVEVKLRR